MKFTLVFLLLAAMCGAAYGQVTIGAGLEPVKGTLLDLKEKNSDGDITATKGLMLPRVILTEPDKLYPMFTGTYDALEDTKHTGLTVYNLGQCDGKFARGVYTWTGTEWMQLTNNPVLTGSNPTLTFNPALPADNMIHIPSGQDGRGNSTATPINFTWGNATLANWSNLAANSSGSMSGGLTFNDAGSGLTPAGVPDLTGTGTWTIPGASALTITPDNLSSIVTANPWATRQSKLTITGVAGAGGSPGNPCGGGTDQTQEIILNQTNYKIVPSKSTSEETSGIEPTSVVVLRNFSVASLPIHSNVRWKATTTASPAQLAKVLVSDDLTNATVKGGDKSDGTKYTPLIHFNYRSAAAENAVKYEMVDVTYEDANIPKRAPDITVTFVQCQGSENMSGVKTATPAQTAAGDAGWNMGATKAERVVRHKAKYIDPDDEPKGKIYEEFYSADFGDAGRWMTTNLAAWAYDWPSGTPPALGGVDASSSLTDPRWCYPKNGAVVAGEAAPTDWRSQYGLLYNWAAATGNQNTSTRNQGQVAGASPGQYEVESLAPGGHYQGICPAGWHLPSDREWNQLEKEIYNNPQLYSTYHADELPFTSTYNTGVGAGSDGTAQPGWRAEWESGRTENNPPNTIGGYGQRGADQGAASLGRGRQRGHGLVLRDECGEPYAGQDTRGRANPVHLGGFGMILAGEVNVANGTNTTWGIMGVWGTSSASNSQDWLYRDCQMDFSAVRRYGGGRARMFQVRCKKN